MTAGQVSGLVGFSAMLAVGQTLFKVAAQAAAKSVGGGFNVALLLQAPSFWAALVLYGFATLLWIYLLQVVPLSAAYPFAALGFIIVPTLAVLLFGEKVSVTYVIGAALIVSGILVTTRG